jgi:hypothetical protein
MDSPILKSDVMYYGAPNDAMYEVPYDHTDQNI